MDVKIIEDLARVMKENGLTALELSEEGVSVKLERKPEIAAQAPSLSEVPARPLPPFAPAAVDGSETFAASQAEQGTVVASPTVGVFYTSPSPEGEPFVRVGDKVKKGDILCIIEAMKLMNEIPAEVSGKIAEICVSNGQVVEYGQPLFRIV